MGSEKIPEGLVKKEMMVIVALVALGVGFFGGVIFSSFQAPQQPVMVAQNNTSAQAGNQAPVGLNAEIGAKILSVEEELKANPNNGAMWAQLGNLYFDSNQPPKAIEAYKKSLEINPSQPDVLTDMGVMYRNTRQFKEALAAFDKAISLNPSQEQAWFNKGLVSITDLGDKAGGVAAWQKVITLNPEARTPQGQPVRDLIAAALK